MYSYIHMSHVTSHMNESCHVTYRGVMTSLSWAPDTLRSVYQSHDEWAHSYIHMSHATSRMNESCHLTYESIMPYFVRQRYPWLSLPITRQAWTSHVTSDMKGSWLIHRTMSLCGWLIYSVQHTATHCNTLQYTAIHCNTLIQDSSRVVHCLQWLSSLHLLYSSTWLIRMSRLIKWYVHDSSRVMHCLQWLSSWHLHDSSTCESTHQVICTSLL